jgi:hypothetical protein
LGFFGVLVGALTWRVEEGGTLSVSLCAVWGNLVLNWGARGNPRAGISLRTTVGGSY